MEAINILTYRNEINGVKNTSSTLISEIVNNANGKERSTWNGNLLFNGETSWNMNDGYWVTDNTTKITDGYNSVINNVSTTIFILLLSYARDKC